LIDGTCYLKATDTSPDSGLYQNEATESGAGTTLHKILEHLHHPMTVIHDRKKFGIEKDDGYRAVQILCYPLVPILRHDLMGRSQRVVHGQH
jgi:hypothetical protein